MYEIRYILSRKNLNLHVFKTYLNDIKDEDIYVNYSSDSDIEIRIFSNSRQYLKELYNIVGHIIINSFD